MRMVGRSVFLIDFIGGAVQGIHGIKTHASLKAGSGFVGDEPQHLHFFDEVIAVLVNMGETVDLFAGQMGGGGHEVFVLGVLGKFIGLGRRVDVGKKGPVGGNVLHFLSFVVDDRLQFFQTVDVIFFASYHLPDSLSFISSDRHRKWIRSFTSLPTPAPCIPSLKSYYRPFNMLFDMTSL